MDKKFEDNPTEWQLTEFLISKIKQYNNITIATKEINNDKGNCSYYTIKTTVNLSQFGNHLFYSAKLNTVSHVNRIVNIKCIFADNDNLKKDMQVNADALIQLFRAVGPDTITNVHLETFVDQFGFEHLSVSATTIKGASLIYVYKRVMDFIKAVDEKYGKLPEDDSEFVNPIAMHIKNNEPVANGSTPNSKNKSANSQSTTSNYSTDNKSYAAIVKKPIVNEEDVKPVVSSSTPANTTLTTTTTTPANQLTVESVTQSIANTNIITNSSLEEIELQEKLLLVQLEKLKIIKMAKQLNNNNNYNNN
jgi:hypothetical protein